MAKCARKASVKKYKLGDFVSERYEMGGQTYAQVGNMAAGLLNTMQSSHRVNTGLDAASSALSGAGTGAAIGSIVPGVGTLVGAGVGALVGGVSSLITSGSKQRAQDRQDNDFNNGLMGYKDSFINTNNSNAFGQQMEYGGQVGDPPPKKKPTQVSITPSNNGWPAPGDPYWKEHPLVTEHSDGTLRQWGEDTLKHKNDPIVMPTKKPTIQDALHPQVAQQFNSYYPGIGWGNNPAPSFSNGGSIGLTGRAGGRFSVPNAGLRHFAPHMNRPGKINPIPNSGTIDFSQQDPENKMAMGGTTPNSQQNMINIQKGELLIDPTSGKILQNYKGINPLTGGLYENHSKDQSTESPNNFTLADPGLFVITQKTAPQYKEAVDNNDKISQKTVLMNIRNAKIAKEGGLQRNYAYGDTIYPANMKNDANQIDSIPELNDFHDATNSAIINDRNGLSAPKPNISATSGGTNWGNIADTATKYGPGIINTMQGLFGNANHQGYVTPIANPDRANVIANMPKDVNMNPIINDIYSNQALENKNIQDNTNNGGVYRANRQNVAAGTNRALTDARMKASEINNQAAGQRAYMYNALGYQQQQEQQKVREYNLGIDDVNARRDAAKQNLLNAGLSQLQSTSMNDKANSQHAAMDKYTLDLMRQIFPNLKYYDDFNSDKINKRLGR